MIRSAPKPESGRFNPARDGVRRKAVFRTVNRRQLAILRHPERETTDHEIHLRVEWRALGYAADLILTAGKHPTVQFLRVSPEIRIVREIS